MTHHSAQKETEVKAYILVKTAPGGTGEAVGMIAKAKGVVSAEVTFGPYDIVVQVEGETLEAIAKTVVWQIRTVPGVLDTLSCIAAKV